MTSLTLEAAEHYAKSAARHARAASMNALGIAVVDSGGALIYAMREDGGGLAAVDIALGKARAALTFGCTSKQIADALAGNPLAGPSVLSVLDGRIVLLGGGVLLKGADGATIGAIGVAGGPPDSDEAAAFAGAAA